MKATATGESTSLPPTTASSPPPTAPSIDVKETEPAAKLPEKEADNSTRPLAMTAPSARVDELTTNTSTAAAAPPPTPPDPVSLPAQIAREQLASGKAAEPQPTVAAQSARIGRGQRVVGAARDVVEERLAPRVEKLRQASNVVWGEAQDDPNLRFILIALFLFIVAIVIILLGTYLR